MAIDNINNKIKVAVMSEKVAVPVGNTIDSLTAEERKAYVAFISLDFDTRKSIIEQIKSGDKQVDKKIEQGYRVYKKLGK